MPCIYWYKFSRLYLIYTLPTGVLEIINFSRTFIGHDYFILSLCYLLQWVEQVFFNKYTNWTLVLAPLDGRGGGEVYYFRAQKMQNTKFVKTAHAGRRMPAHSKRSIEWLRWPKIMVKWNIMRARKPSQWTGMAHVDSGVINRYLLQVLYLVTNILWLVDNTLISSVKLKYMRHNLETRQNKM